ncbi:hypothetical protein C0993_003247, partial [Termitomyces sp. T159_Od127]
MSNLAATLRRVGKLEDAKKLNQEVLKIRTEAFGAGHPDIIRAMSSLAAILKECKKAQKAEKLDQTVLKGRTEAFGM